MGGGKIFDLWNNKDKPINNNFNEGLSGVNNSSNEFFTSFKQIFSNIFNKNIEDEFVIPKICVVGSQSSGKSSLLENITKTPIFPKDKDLCTKQPIHLTLKNNETKKYYLNGESIKKNKIQENIKKIFDKNESISEEIINVSISNDDLINFEFIDCPGIVSFPPETKQKTEQLSEKYISNKNNIILCVIPCTISHISSCATLALIQKHGMEKNTIIVFTMADKVPISDIGDNIISRILNKSSEINLNDYLACSVIINRDHNNTIGLLENDTNSDRWFKTHVSDMIPDDYQEKAEIVNKLGIKNLIDNLNLYYKKFIKQEWIPNTKEMLQQNIDHNKKELLTLGIKPCDIDKYKLIKIYIDLVIPQYIHVLNKIKISTKYTDYKDFNKYFESVVKEIEQLTIYDNKYDYLDFDDIEMMKPISGNNKNEIIQIKTNYVLNRFEDINNSIQEILLNFFKIYSDRYIWVAKSTIMMDVFNKRKHGLEYDYTLLFESVIYEITHIDLDLSECFDNIEEDEEFAKKRQELEITLKSNDDALGNLTKMNDTLEPCYEMLNTMIEDN
jgi:GTP-binding protein EngB required for normal cell division